jgi:hypothetical protein
MEGTAEMAEDVCAKRARGGAEGAPRRATEAERAEKGRRGGGGRGEMIHVENSAE